MSQVIISNSFRGGTGKTTILSNIATTLGMYGKKVVIIDADIISPGIHAVFGLSYKDFDKTLTDYLVGTGNIIDSVYDISESLNLPDDTLFLIPSSMFKGDIVSFLKHNNRSEKLTKAIEKIKKELAPDYILIDTHPGINEELLIASHKTDLLLNIVRPDNQDYQGLEISRDIAKKIGIRMSIILNKVHPRLNKHNLAKDITEKFKLPIAGILPQTDDIILAQSRFIFSDKYPEHEFSNEIRNIIYNALNLSPPGHLEIMHQILSIIPKDKEIKIEDIIQSRKLKNFNSSSMKYLEELLERGYINKTNDSIMITDKGTKFLKKYSTIRRFIDKFRL